MKKKGFMKRLGVCLIAAAMVLGTALPVSAAAVTKRAQKTITAGQSYHVMNTRIGGNNITSYTIYVSPRTSGTRYDLAAATCYADENGNYLPTETLYKNSNKMVMVDNKAGTFVKSSAGSNVGMLACITVRKGSVNVRVDYKTTNRTMALSFQAQKKNHKTLRYKRVPAGKQALFTMTRGNLTGTPLILSATAGSVMRRDLSADNSYKNYTFGPSKLDYSVYYKGKLLTSYSKSLGYDTTYSSRRFILLRTKTRDTGWMESAAGTMTYFYPADYVGMRGQIK